MGGLQKYKKPELAILEEQPKIREYEGTEQLSKCLTLVETLLLDLGVSGKADSKQHQRAIVFIIDSMRNYSFEEIHKAFKLFIAGELREKPLQQLNSLVIGKVMSQYQEYKNEKLKLYRMKQRDEELDRDVPSIDEQEKMLEDRIVQLYLEYSSTGDITGPVTHVYDYLAAKKELPKHDREFKARILEKAKALAKRYEAEKAMKSISAAKAMRMITDQINAGTHDSLKAICKRVVLREYFKEKIKKANNQDIEE